MIYNGFVHNKKGDVEYLTIPSFTATGVCSHAFTLRHGGVSEGYLSSLNFGLSRGDKTQNVRENIEIISKAASLSGKKSVYTLQKHGDKIEVVTERHAGMGAFLQSEIGEADALITNTLNLPLVAYFADCVPIFLLDPIKRVICVCHSGWKGTVLKISQKSVSKMSAEFGCLPEDILAAVGPSIGPCHFEVDADVAEKFKEAFPQKEGFIHSLKGEKYFIDLWGAVTYTLKCACVSNITVANECTFCNPSKYYSHRYFKGQTGNMAAIIELKGEF